MACGRGDIRGSCAFQDVLFISLLDSLHNLNTLLPISGCSFYILTRFLAQLEHTVPEVIKQEVWCTSHLFCEVLR